MTDTEYRFTELEHDPATRVLSGVVMRYGDTASLPGGYRERFERGAFGNVGGLDVRLNVMHERARILTRTGAGLTLEDTGDALRMSAELPETREADDVLTLVRAKIYKGLSAEFAAVQQRMVGGVRVISGARLRGVAVVDDGAYSLSTVAARWRDPGPRRPRRVWY